jgi:hypothetical protein
MSNVGEIAAAFMDRMANERVSWSDSGGTVEITIGDDDYYFSFNIENPDMETHRRIAESHNALIEAIEEADSQ